MFGQARAFLIGLAVSQADIDAGGLKGDVGEGERGEFGTTECAGKADEQQRPVPAPAYIGGGVREQNFEVVARDGV